MNSTQNMAPDVLFEVSWEVCNKVGGIHTVLATKAAQMKRRFGEHYIPVGPDISREMAHPEFVEDPELWRPWRDRAAEIGIRTRAGYWRTAGDIPVILVDFSTFIPQSDRLLRGLWEDFGVDSISGGWDYIEPVLFGLAVGTLIAAFAQVYDNAVPMITAHFHEWMTVSGALYLKKNTPSVATVFTTHATVLGRAIASARLNLYDNLAKFDPVDSAKMVGVTAKYSIESVASHQVDCFTAVSEITAEECRYLTGTPVNVVTPNGFELTSESVTALRQTRSEVRERLLRVAGFCNAQTYDKQPFVVMTAGRYEFHNKGYDLFCDSLLQLAQRCTTDRRIVAVLAVPAATGGARTDLVRYLQNPRTPQPTVPSSGATHLLTHPDSDPILQHIKQLPQHPQLDFLFIPTYLDGRDGIFDCSYYQMLTTADAAVYLSYYEPWGYTPMESLRLGIPTVVSSLAGFARWAQQETIYPKTCLRVVERTDQNTAKTVEHVADELLKFFAESPSEESGTATQTLMQAARWEYFMYEYDRAYDNALHRMSERTHHDRFTGSRFTLPVLSDEKERNPLQPNWMRIVVERELPASLHPLEELTHNLWWSWNSSACAMFRSIDPTLWESCGENPIVFLDGLNSRRFHRLTIDADFMERMLRVYREFRQTMDAPEPPESPRIAYFSMEYGLHRSLNLYSGGLGVLAGDYLKQMSDSGLRSVAFGILYRYGYFSQRLSAAGDQESVDQAQNFYKLPITPCLNAQGQWITVPFAFPGRVVTARVWRCAVGRTDLYLFDTDHEMNRTEDRRITGHLYGGDADNRIKQELILGVGGIRLLELLDIRPDIFHCNEGHAAFAAIERLRMLVEQEKLSFEEALEVVRTSQLFTTHTPVAAGHDLFPEGLVRQYFSHYPERLGIDWDRLMTLAQGNDLTQKQFSMSNLLARLSGETNGVSRLHAQVSRQIFNPLYPGYFADEIPVGYVTNGVHYATWTAESLQLLYDEFNPSTEEIPCRWGAPQRIIRTDDIPDDRLWNERQKLKRRLIDEIRRRVENPAEFRFDSPRQMAKIRESLQTDVLTVGFARRFATYKRAFLLFQNLDRLARIVNHPTRPMQFIFAGKAHPNDVEGQKMIKQIVEISQMPQFVGRIIFLQNYEIALATQLVQGVDVWLNLPMRGMEASGTSGQKAALNGVLNCSVMDGWWCEGYREGAGWQLSEQQTYDDPRFQDEMDAELLYNLFEEQIAPLYYARDASGRPHEWLQAVRKSITEVASNYTANRMFEEYQAQYYRPMFARSKRMTADSFAGARALALWKRRVERLWSEVRVIDLELSQITKSVMRLGENSQIRLQVELGELSADELSVELIYTSQLGERQPVVQGSYPFKVEQYTGTHAVYVCEVSVDRTGTFEAAIRLFPTHPDLHHQTDFGLMKWV